MREDHGENLVEWLWLPKGLLSGIMHVNLMLYLWFFFQRCYILDIVKSAKFGVDARGFRLTTVTVFKLISTIPIIKHVIFFFFLVIYESEALL